MEILLPLCFSAQHTFVGYCCYYCLLNELILFGVGSQPSQLGKRTLCGTTDFHECQTPTVYRKGLDFVQMLPCMAISSGRELRERGSLSRVWERVSIYTHTFVKRAISCCKSAAEIDQCWQIYPFESRFISSICKWEKHKENKWNIYIYIVEELQTARKENKEC